MAPKIIHFSLVALALTLFADSRVIAQETNLSSDAAAAPAGATGICNDGTYVFSAEAKGSCHKKQGLKEWFAASRRRAQETGAQPRPPAPAPTDIGQLDPEFKQALLAEKGFDVDWICEASGGASSRGSSEVSFRAELPKLIVNINNYSAGSCKTEARVTADGVTWDGCRDASIEMKFDAANKQMPFIGKSTQCTYRFKSK